MDHRLRNTGKPAPPNPPSPHPSTPLVGREPGKVPGSGLREIHEHPTAKECSACREDLAAPELNYRLVLRCTTTGLDH